MRILIIFILTLLWSGLNIVAQTRKDRIRPLVVGDTLPFITHHQVMNYPTDSLNMAGFRGKLLILDFWATTCYNCFAEWPKLKELQREFDNRVQILLVNSELGGRKKLENFFDGPLGRKVHRFALPSLIEDTLLRNMFPHRSIPHAAWIDGKGKVIAITDGRYITRDNIQLALEGRLSLPQKQDSLYLDFSKPLLMEGNGADDMHFKYRSILSPFINGLPAAFSRKKGDNGHVTKITLTNTNIVTLYKAAYEKEIDSYASNANIDIKLEDTIPYTIPKSFEEQENWRFDHLWCYEILLVSHGDTGAIYRMMRSDLDNFFSISSFIERRKVQCLVLHKLVPESSTLQVNGSSDKVQVGVNLKSLVSKLKMLKGMPVILDEMNGDYSSFPNLKSDLKNLEALQSELLSFGVRLDWQEREIPVLVIRNNK